MSEHAHPRLYRDAFALATWVLGRLDERRGFLAGHTCEAAVSLLDDAVLALDDRSQSLHVVDATMRLRQRLRLLTELGTLTDQQMLHALRLVSTLVETLQSGQYE